MEADMQSTIPGETNVKTNNGIADDQSPLVRALIGLTVVTGLVDAISFLGLGHIFTANMTGNVVFLGFAAGGAPGISAARSIAALCAFVVGGACGGRLTGSRERTPAGHLLTATYVETALLLTAAVAAAFVTSDVPPAIGYAIVVVTAMAMGLRNAVVRKLAVPDLTTTVLTMTLTALAADSSVGGVRTGRRVLSVIAMFAGALAGAILLRVFGLAAPLGIAALMVAGLTVDLHLQAR
jgi:uncharacterized membrane protein YoaK (UPF0700 family)